MNFQLKIFGFYEAYRKIAKENEKYSGFLMVNKKERVYNYKNRQYFKIRE